MPTIGIHEEVAYLIAKKYLELDTSDFYLGALAPDSINLEGFASKEIRWISHLRANDLDTWLNNTKEFYQNNKNNYHKYFLLGYILHIITDIVHDRDFYEKMQAEMNKDNIPFNNQHNLIRSSMEDYDKQTKQEPFWSHIKEKLQNVTGYNIRNITKEKLLAWKNKCLSNDNCQNKINKYINKDDIINLTKEVEKEFISICYKK